MKMKEPYMWLDIKTNRVFVTDGTRKLEVDPLIDSVYRADYVQATNSYRMEINRLNARLITLVSALKECFGIVAEWDGTRNLWSIKKPEGPVEVTGHGYHQFDDIYTVWWYSLSCGHRINLTEDENELGPYGKFCPTCGKRIVIMTGTQDKKAEE